MPSIEAWKKKGYTEEHVFPGEYTLLMNPTTFDRVRVYENGQVWMTDLKTGMYNLI